MPMTDRMSKHDGDSEKERVNTIDLGDFVREVERFARLIEPFALVLYALDDLRRWRQPNISGILWFLANLCCVVLSQASVFVLVSVLVVTIALVCLLQNHYRILDRSVPDSRRLPPPEPEEEVDSLQTVREFRYSLIQVHDFIVKSNEYMAYLYALLKWDVKGPAALFHSELCVLLLGIVVFPTRWLFLLLINWFFLCHEDTLIYLRQHWSALSGQKVEAGVSSPAPTQSPPNSTNKGPSELPASQDDEDVTDSEGEEGYQPEPEAMVPLDPPPSKPGMVRRLMEIRQRRQQMANETCHNCNVSFSSILKRRHYCRHCGYNFCNKCCNQKVPRSTFGATSPAAQTETVLVCGACYTLLMRPDEAGDKDKGS